MTSKGLEEHSLTIKNRHLDTSNSIILDRLKQKNTSKKNIYFGGLKKERNLIETHQPISGKDRFIVINARYFLIKNLLNLSFFAAIQNKINQKILKNNDPVLEKSKHKTLNKRLNVPFKFLQQKFGLINRKTKPIILPSSRSIDHSLSGPLRPATCTRDPKILLNASTIGAALDRNGSREQVAGRRRLNCQHTVGFGRISKKYKRLKNKSRSLKRYKILQKKRLLNRINKNRSKTTHYNSIHFFSEKKISWTELEMSLRSKNSANSENYDDKAFTQKKAN